MIGKLVKVAMLGAIVAVVVVTFPDLKRYLDIRKM
jgi:hypothetical protein